MCKWNYAHFISNFAYPLTMFIFSTSSRTLSSTTTSDSTCRRLGGHNSAAAQTAVRTLESARATNGIASSRTQPIASRCHLVLDKWWPTSSALGRLSIKSSASMSAILNVRATKTSARIISLLIRTRGSGKCSWGGFKSTSVQSTPQKWWQKRILTSKLLLMALSHRCARTALFRAQ